MKLGVILLQFVALILPPGGRAQTLPARSQDSDPVSIAIDHYRNLEYDAAKQQLRGWLDTHPTDLRASNYLATATLYNEMFDRGVLESSVYGESGDIFKASKVAVTPAFQQELLSILDKSQQLAEERLKSNPNDKDAMYWAGVSHGTRATYHFALRKEYMPALHEASAAFKYHSALLKTDPDYVDAYLVVGMNNYVVGSLPWYVKVLASLSGRHGDREEGIRQVKSVTERGNFARDDAKVMLAVLDQREKMYAQALALYQDMARSHPRNYLLRYEAANLFGALNDWHSAALAYDAIVARQQAGDSGYEKAPIAKVLYQSGQAYEHLQQYESALDRYSEAGALPRTGRYIYASELAAANLYTRLQQPGAARSHYQRVADATPDTEEGKTARNALKKLDSD
jgi:tetratricopeptide (TPR) repeat protein